NGVELSGKPDLFLFGESQTRQPGHILDFFDADHNRPCFLLSFNSVTLVCLRQTDRAVFGVIRRFQRGLPGYSFFDGLLSCRCLLAGQNFDAAGASNGWMRGLTVVAPRMNML